MNIGDRLIFPDEENHPVYGRIVDLANGHAEVVSFYLTTGGAIKERKHRIKDEPYSRARGEKKGDDLKHQALMLANARR